VPHLNIQIKKIITDDVDKNTEYNIQLWQLMMCKAYNKKRENRQEKAKKKQRVGKK